MQSVYLATYKGTHKGIVGLINIAIRLLDKAKYSHCEICIGHPFESAVYCYSSSGVDGGVRAKNMKLSPDKWDITELPLVDEQSVLDLYKATVGDKYDFWGVGRFAFPFFLRESKTRWFCSEWAGRAIGIPEPWRFSPQALYQIAASKKQI